MCEREGDGGVCVTLRDSEGEKESRSPGCRTARVSRCVLEGEGWRWCDLEASVSRAAGEAVDTLGAAAGFFDTFMLLLLGCLRGDGGRCFPCKALSSWPMFHPL